MTNEEKLKFIQYNYVNSRASELIPPYEKDSFLRAWAEEILTIAPTHLYKYSVRMFKRTWELFFQIRLSDPAWLACNRVYKTILYCHDVAPSEHIQK